MDKIVEDPKKLGTGDPLPLPSQSIPTQSPIDRQPQIDDRRSPGRFGNFQGCEERTCGVGLGEMRAKAETRNCFSGWFSSPTLASELCSCTLSTVIPYLTEQSERYYKKQLEGVTKDTVRPFSADLRAAGRRTQPNRGQRWLLEELPRRVPKVENTETPLTHDNQDQGQKGGLDEGPSEDGHYPADSSLMENMQATGEENWAGQKGSPALMIR
nr:uncharacterized protein LOC109192285 [Ipomoea batatas]